MTNEQLSKLLDVIGDDGHSIYHQRKLEEAAGLEAGTLDEFRRDHVSGGHHKDDIYRPGTGLPGDATVEHLVGVYGLTVLETLAGRLVPDYSNPFIGRGSRAQCATKALREFLAGENGQA